MGKKVVVQKNLNVIVREKPLYSIRLLTPMHLAKNKNREREKDERMEACEGMLDVPLTVINCIIVILH